MGQKKGAERQATDGWMGKTGLNSCWSLGQMVSQTSKNTGTEFYGNRPRRQNFNGILIENGAVYISRVDKILNSNCRLSGNIKPYEMNKKSFVEIDEPDDFFISEFLMKQNHL